MKHLPEQIIDAERRKLFDFSELWQYRELFFFFTWRDIKIKYKQTVLGFLWVVLQPLLMMLIFTFFFGRVLKIPSQNIPYPVFVFSGLLLWNGFANGLTNAANSMINNASIIKKIYFPRLVIPVSSIFVALFDLLVAFLLLIPLLAFYQQSVHWTAIVLWPGSIFLCLISVLGAGSLLASLNLKYRDFRYLIPFLIQVMFFATPVIYPVAMLEHPILKFVVSISPMYATIELFRFPLTNASLDVLLVSISIISSFCMLIVGLFYFKRTEDFFADLA